MKIGELARRTKLNASAIRYYEEMGVLVAPQRVFTSSFLLTRKHSS